MDPNRKKLCCFLGLFLPAGKLLTKRKQRKRESSAFAGRCSPALTLCAVTTSEQTPTPVQSTAAEDSAESELQLQLLGPLRRRSLWERVDHYRQQVAAETPSLPSTRNALLSNFVPRNKAAAEEGLGLEWDEAIEELACAAPATICPVIRFTCRRGHVVSVAANSKLASRGECPVCQYAARCGRASSLREYRPLQSKRFERYTLDMLKAAAMERGGELLSTEYVNARRKLLWRCGQCKHEWFATTDNILRLGSWCPKCARRQGRNRVTLADMQAIADMHGGVCLSKEYRGAMVPLQFRCAEGHEFWANPNNIRRGIRGHGTQRKPSWCPHCARERRQKS